MPSPPKARQHIPVLIVGGGPVGLALAADLGWRGVSCLLVEKENAVTDHPRANAQNARTMEFFRRWGIADAVREAGTPPDFPHTALYVTQLTGYEIARIERPHHGGGRAPLPFSPERPQRCNQLMLDPILRQLASSFPTVELRFRTQFENLVEHDDHVIATVRDVASGETYQITADYVVACCGGHSSIPKTLGARMEGDAVMDYNLNVIVRIQELWRYHDKGKAALIFFIGPQGRPWCNLVELNGRDLWRFAITGRQYYDHPEKTDVTGLLTKAVGVPVPYEIHSFRRWIARDLVADRYGEQRVFLAGDACHQNPPTGGFGLNTGMGDAVDLSWKLAARLAGWGGERLLASYGVERRPVALRNVREAAASLRVDHSIPARVAIADDSAAGEAARREVGAMILASKRRMLISDGIALGYCYDKSPIIWDDGSAPASDATMQYTPTTRPGARAPHAWVGEGRSTLDLFGRGFTLMRFGANAPDVSGLQRAFAQRAIPLSVASIDDPAIAELYERRLVLVRPDGHVAWRADSVPELPLALCDRVRGA